MIRVNYTSSTANRYYRDQEAGLCTIKTVSPYGPHFYEDIVLEVTYTDPELEVMTLLSN